jgi:hypothetical protein
MTRYGFQRNTSLLAWRSPISTLTGCSSDPCEELEFRSVMFFVCGGSSSPSAAHLTTYISTRPSGRGHSRVTFVESTRGAMFDTGFGPVREYRFRDWSRSQTFVDLMQEPKMFPFHHSYRFSRIRNGRKQMPLIPEVIKLLRTILICYLSSKLTSCFCKYLYCLHSIYHLIFTSYSTADIHLFHWNFTEALCYIWGFRNLLG